MRWMGAAVQNFKTLGLSVLCIFVFAGAGYAGEDAVLHAMAVKAAKAGQRDFAFMHYRALLRRFPDSPFAEEALLAKGEYHFLLPRYRESASAFREFLSRYPDSEAKLFAMAHRFRIAQIGGHESLADDFKKQIITLKQVSLVFREYKEYTYRSPLGREFRAVFHIDKIEFYVNGELFAEISY